MNPSRSLSLTKAPQESRTGETCGPEQSIDTRRPRSRSQGALISQAKDPRFDPGEASTNREAGEGRRGASGLFEDSRHLCGEKPQLSGNWLIFMRY
jgi:hypothetical protein